MDIAAITSIWNGALNETQSASTEVLSVIHEDFLNDFLRAHWNANKNERYKQTLKKEFVLDGKSRIFEANVEIAAPLEISLPPLSNYHFDDSINDLFSSAEDWMALPQKKLIRNIKGDPANSNIRIVIPNIKVQFKWPKWDKPSENWIFPETSFSMMALAEGKLSVEDSPEQPGDSKALQVLKINLHKIRFDKAPSVLISEAITSLTNRGIEDLVTANESEQKILDLMLILLNVLGSEYTPTLVASIPLPTPTLFDKKFYLSVAALRDKAVVVGLTIDAESYRADLQQNLSRNVNAYLELLDLDIKRAGGIDAIAQGIENLESQEVEAILSDRLSLSSQFMLESGFRDEPESEYEYENDEKTAATANFDIALAVNEYLIDVILDDALPKPVEDSTDWISLGVVRGRIRWWLKLYEPDITFSAPGTISGQVGVDVGGGIEACVKKFWDCSWKWECGLLGLGIDGYPKISLYLATAPSSGITFTAKLDAGLRLRTRGVPFPFDKIIDSLGTVVVRAITDIISMLISFMKFRIVPPVIPLANEKVKIEMRQIQPFFYSSPVAAGSRKRFMGFGVDTRISNL